MGVITGVILKENDNSEVFKITIRTKTNYQGDIVIYYSEGIFSIRRFHTIYNGGDMFCFKMDFKDTPIMIKRILDGEDGYLASIYHKDNVKQKK